MARIVQNLSAFVPRLPSNQIPGAGKDPTMRLTRKKSYLEAVFRRPNVKVMMTLMVVCLLWPGTSRGNPPTRLLDAELLHSFILRDDQHNPLVAFGEVQNRVETSLSRENRAYLGGNQALMDKIRTELAADSLQWQLSRASMRLMIVPEQRPAYAALFENYCQAAVEFVLAETCLPNPYHAITTFQGDDEVGLATPARGGVTAYLVHNIADVYTEEYVFSAAEHGGPQVKIKLSNRNFNGEVGSYSSYIVVDDNQDMEFIRSAYTLWQNSAKDPLNVLIAPVEETLHIALRDFTEEAIAHRLASRSNISRPFIDQVVEEWLAVEEAAVGGLVRQLMPEIMARYLTSWPCADLDATLEARRTFDKYRYLNQGIRIVEELGIEAFIDLYRQDPRAFRSMLIATMAGSQASPPQAAAKQAQAEPSIQSPSSPPGESFPLKAIPSSPETIRKPS